MHSGIETGMVVTLRNAFLGAVAGLVGDTVNVAARLEDLSSTGEILVGPNTYQLVANLVDVEEHGRVELKGKAVPVSAGAWSACGCRWGSRFPPDPVRRSSAC